VRVVLGISEQYATLGLWFDDKRAVGPRLNTPSAATV
jgi:hypothetical protein